MQPFFQGNQPTTNMQGQTSMQSDFVAPPQTDDGYFENSPAYQGSIQQILADNIGQYVVCEFLIGTSQIVSRQGVLYHVGVSYIVLYDETNGTYMICDLYSIKFVTFFRPDARPDSRTTRNSNSRR